MKFQVTLQFVHEFLGNAISPVSSKHVKAIFLEVYMGVQFPGNETSYKNWFLYELDDHLFSALENSGMSKLYMTNFTYPFFHESERL